MKTFEKKLRIQLYDSEMNQLSDRLVEQDLEFRKGPSNVHDGPVKVEVFLLTPEDVEAFKVYLDKLSGSLPKDFLPSRKNKKFPKVSQDDELDSALITELGNLTDPEEFNETITSLGFVFVTYELIKDLNLPITLSDELTEADDFRLLIRLLRTAKNPLNNKYDPNTVIAVSRIKNEPGVKIFHFNKLVLELPLDLKPSKITVPTSNLTKFPSYMTQEERNKFRVEKEKLIKDPDLLPSKFYKRWVHMIAEINPSGIEFPRLSEIPKPY